MTLLSQVGHVVAQFQSVHGVKPVRVHLTQGQVLAIQREEGLQPTQFFSEIGGAAVRVSDVFCIVGVG